MKLAVYRSDGDDAPQILEISKKRIRIGRDAGCEVAVDGSKFPKVSGLHAELISKDGQLWLVHRSKSNATVVDKQAIDKPMVVRPGMRFRLGFTGPELEILELPGPDSRGAQTMFAGKASDYLSADQLAGTRFQVSDGGILGRDEGATFRLEHPYVSRRHASIKLQKGAATITDLGSANGTFVDGKRISGACRLAVGNQIDIGPFSLVFDGQNLIGRSRLNNVCLTVKDLNFVVDDKTTRRKLHLLQGVSFSVEPGEFVAVLGPSGSGKSTLLRIISGRQWPFSGSAKINDQDIHTDFATLKEDIVVVPQSTRFHDVLAVRDVISYAASLRLPVDTSRQERSRVVETSLSRVGLEERAVTRVNNLSGGQQKRLALANELVSDPSLLFLDEVTSGLDEKADGEMMHLLRSLSDSGKTILCVTHNLGYVEACCHKVLILTVGGRVAFYGAPVEAREYFGVASIGDIYEMLATKTPEQWAVNFLNSHSMGSDDAVEKGSAPPSQKVTKLSSIQRLGLRPLAQTVVLAKRYLHIWQNDWQALVALFGQAALVAILLCLVFNSIPEGDDPAGLLTRKTELRNLLFLIGISCFWLGANNSAKELVKERVIYQRERNFNLSPEAYWVSKALVLSMIGCLQSAILTAGVIAVCDVPGNMTGFLGCSLLLSLIGTSLGIAVSAWSNTEELSVALVPIVVIPQIILAGVVAQLNDASSILAKGFTTSFWGQKVYERILPEVDRVATDEKIGLMICVTVLAIQLGVFGIVGWVGIRFRKSTSV